MKNLKIHLIIDGKKKKFKAPKFISGSVFQKTMELERVLDNIQDYNIVFEKLYPLICDVFGNQFTPEQLRKGVDIREIIPLANSVTDHVICHMQLSNKIAGVHSEGKVVLFEKNNRKFRRN
ncbi:hypothetical protein CVD25_06500 [Bacillus canaveralius]|uniref:Uncharacterized protein n=1 Tax=Bacillus canaveralius TaxID=1403243 RepID=A0A2N5GG71_9BACI|nr:hypothetical protein [Bacillus canaveralius]PLR79700.1 hypothetical protein CU635_21645 [Bacillus canaveralius]PLR99168.1 hypothetical protein CVD25_06500 [Bacillus canaveralius]